MFRLAMLKLPLGAYKVEMTAPEGSTAGGTRAMQHIRLVPPNGQGQPIIAGNANVSTSTGELRTLDHIDELCRERFGLPSGIDAAAYSAFLDEAEAVLQAFGIKVEPKGAPSLAGESLPPPVQRALLVPVLIALILGLGALAAYGFIARH
jgi:hypothetical protein